VLLLYYTINKCEQSTNKTNICTNTSLCLWINGLCISLFKV